MNTGLHPAAEQWVGIVNGELACHTGIIQFPMRKGWKRVHRLVVLPDYQGVGIGIKFINKVSEHYTDWNMNLTTTTPALVGGLKRSNKWILKRYGRVTNVWGNRSKCNKKTSIVKGSSENRITYSFNFKNNGVQ